MTDEKFVFIQDVKEKKSTATGAFHKKGKSRKCTLPSDYLTKKEREKMNGECKTWNMNDFYSWNEFKQMPKDIAAAYISTLNQKYHVSMSNISRILFNVGQSTLSAYIHKSGIKDLMKIKQVLNRGEENKTLVEFKNAIIAARVAKETLPKDIFVLNNMQREDAIEMADKINKNLLKNSSDAESTVDNSNNSDEESVSVPNAVDDIHLTSGVFTMNGFDFKLLNTIASLFDGRNVNVRIIVEE